MEFSKYILGFGLALGLCLVAYPLFIPFLHKLKYGQTVSEYMPSQAKKTGTPTMGGVIFIAVPLLVSAIVFPQVWSDPKVVLIALAFVGYGIIGFIDDYIIVVTKNNNGLSPRSKLLLQVILSVIFYMIYQSHVSTEVSIFNFTIDLGVFYILLVVLLFASATNAVNLTDGMDGLAGGTVFISYIPFVLFAVGQGEYNVALFTVIIMGAILGYLFFNRHPAKIFMGDSGSLALGGVLAALGFVLKKELLVIVIGMVFVIETASVVLQIASVKIRHKRIFKCSPIHYHFEQCGMKEEQVVLMEYIAGAIFALIGYIIGR